MKRQLSWLFLEKIAAKVVERETPTFLTVHAKIDYYNERRQLSWLFMQKWLNNIHAKIVERETLHAKIGTSKKLGVLFVVHPPSWFAIIF